MLQFLVVVTHYLILLCCSLGMSRVFWIVFCSVSNSAYYFPQIHHSISYIPSVVSLVGHISTAAVNNNLYYNVSDIHDRLVLLYQNMLYQVVVSGICYCNVCLVHLLSGIFLLKHSIVNMPVFLPSFDSMIAFIILLSFVPCAVFVSFYAVLLVPCYAFCLSLSLCLLFCLF